MIREAMQHADLWQWQAAALVLFCLMALGIGVYLVRRGAGPFYEKLADLPLEEDHIFDAEE